MYRSKIVLAVAAIAAAALVSTGAQAAGNLVANGSFESSAGFIGNGQNAMSLPVGSMVMPSWTVIGIGDVAWETTPNPFGVAASDGLFYLDLTGYTDRAPYAGVEQSIATVNGGVYQLSFDLGTKAQYGVPAGIFAQAGATSGSFSSSAPDVGPLGAWVGQTLTFTASGPTTLISLRGNLGRAYIGLDNVSVVELSRPGGVPEPATWAMMLVGFGGLGAVLRSRRVALAA